MSISLGFQIFANLCKWWSFFLCFGPLYHIAFIVMKVDFWCTRPSSEAFSRFSGSFLSWQVFRVLFLPHPLLMAYISFLLIHTHLPTPASWACQMSLAWLSAFVTFTSVFFLSLAYCLTSMAAALSLLVCHSAPSPTLIACTHAPLRYVMCILHVQN